MHQPGRIVLAADRMDPSGFSALSDFENCIPVLSDLLGADGNGASYGIPSDSEETDPPSGSGRRTGPYLEREEKKKKDKSATGQVSKSMLIHLPF